MFCVSFSHGGEPASCTTATQPRKKQKQKNKSGWQFNKLNLMNEKRMERYAIWSQFRDQMAPVR